MEENNICILVNSCDNYSDIWDPFFVLFKRFWPDCSYSIVLNTERKSFSFEGLRIQTFQLFKDDKRGRIPYGERMMKTLQSIHSEFVIMLMDDFFIRDAVDVVEIQNVINFMRSANNIASVVFSVSYDRKDISCAGLLGYRETPHYADYHLDFQAGIWNRTKLLSYWKPYDTPWSWELYSNVRTFKSNDRFFKLDEKTSRPIVYYEDQSDFFRFGLRNGKWYKESVEELFADNCIIVDFSERGEYQEVDEDSLSNIKKLCRASDLKKMTLAFRCMGIYWWTMFCIWKYKWIANSTTHDFVMWWRDDRKTLW